MHLAPSPLPISIEILDDDTGSVASTSLSPLLSLWSFAQPLSEPQRVDASTTVYYFVVSQAPAPVDGGAALLLLFFVAFLACFLSRSTATTAATPTVATVVEKV